MYFKMFSALVKILQIKLQVLDERIFDPQNMLH